MKVAALALLLASSVRAAQIEHVVYVMLENHAFDNMLGWLPGVDGLSASDCNADSVGVVHCATTAGAWVDPDPDHSVPATAAQIYGKGVLTPANEHMISTETMSGFVVNYASTLANASGGARIMDALTPSAVPIVSTLASAFAVLDGYHASVPGPTFPNRLFALSATSHGFGDNDDVQTALGWPQRSIFSAISATPSMNATHDWRVYFSDVPSALLMADARNLSDLGKYRFFEESWAADCARGDLPFLSWVEPGFLDIPGIRASDEHPAHDVLDGERFLKSIYEPLRASALWEKTVLLITWDEHGGFYDHVPPPVVGVPSPDGMPCVGCDNTPFNFTRLGIRVPMLVVSPWVAAGTVVHAPTSGSRAYDHGSLAATLKNILPGFPGPLTARDAWSLPLDSVWSSAAAPRTDCPMTLPPIPTDAVSPSMVGVSRMGEGPVNHLQDSLLLLAEAAARGYDAAVAGTTPELAAAAIKSDLMASGALASEAAAGLYARARFARLKARA